MARSTYYFTSESVSEGHPDKVSDRISDEIVDLYFRKSVAAGMSPWDVRVAAETLTTTNKVVIAGETRGMDVSKAEVEATESNTPLTRDCFSPRGISVKPKSMLSLLLMGAMCHRRAGNASVQTKTRHYA